MTKIKNHCEKHEEYNLRVNSSCHRHIEIHPHCPECDKYRIKYIHCPDCQRALAELWADRWGWVEGGNFWYDGNTSLYVADLHYTRARACLTDKAISLEGAYKSWEWAEEQGGSIAIDDGRVRFTPYLAEFGNTSYEISKYGKATAIILAASEVEAKIK